MGPTTPTHPQASHTRHTGWRLTPDDDTALANIAAALHAEGKSRFPTRTSALRFALQATTHALQTTGRLPAIPQRGEDAPSAQAQSIS